MEKKKMGISYSFLVVVLFAVVCFLTVYIVVDRKLDESKSGSSVNSNVSENVNESNTNNKNSENGSNVSDNSNVNLLSEEEAIAIGKELHEKAGALYFGRGHKERNSDGSSIYYVLDDKGRMKQSTQEEVIGLGVNPFLKLDMDANRQVFSEYCLSHDFADVLKSFIFYDGNMYIPAGDRGANISYRGFELEISNIEESKIMFKVNEIYYDDPNASLPEDRSQWNIVTNDFVIVKENGIWKVDVYKIAY